MINSKVNIKKIKAATAERNRAAKLLGAFGQHTVKDIIDLLEYFDYKCVKCGATWEQIDHVYPLKNGGSNMALNLVPMCESCNKGKAAQYDDYRTDEQKRRLWGLFFNRTVWRGNWLTIKKSKKLKDDSDKKRKVTKKKKNLKEKMKKDIKENSSKALIKENSEDIEKGNAALPENRDIPDSKPEIIRNDVGQFVKGMSGNPGGRPNVSKDLQLFVRRAIESIDLLNGSARTHKVFGPMLKVVENTDYIVIAPDVWKFCAKTLLEYGYGKPITQVQHKDRDGNDADPPSVQILKINGMEIIF